MRHYIEIIYPGTDSISAARQLGLAILPVGGNIVDVLLRRETSTAFGGDIVYDIRTGVNSSSLATVFASPAHKPTIPTGTLVGGADVAAFPIPVNALDSIGFYRESVIPGGAGARPTAIVVLEDGDPSVQGLGATVIDRLARFTNTTANEIEDAGVAVSIDGTFASDSDAKLPTEKASKTYTDGMGAAAAAAGAAAGAATAQAYADATFAPKTLGQSSKSADYTAVLGDANTEIIHAVGDNNPRTFTIPANSSVAYPVGTILVFVNRINTLSIAITTDTMFLGGSTTTGSRTLAVNGLATAHKVESAVWIITGSGLT